MSTAIAIEKNGGVHRVEAVLSGHRVSSWHKTRATRDRQAVRNPPREIMARHSARGTTCAHDPRLWMLLGGASVKSVVVKNVRGIVKRIETGMDEDQRLEIARQRQPVSQGLRGPRPFLGIRCDPRAHRELPMNPDECNNRGRPTERTSFFARNDEATRSPVIGNIILLGERSEIRGTRINLVITVAVNLVRLPIFGRCDAILLAPPLTPPSLSATQDEMPALLKDSPGFFFMIGAAYCQGKDDGVIRLALIQREEGRTGIWKPGL